MDLYKEALESMFLLLDKAGEKHWKDWIAKDLIEWQYGSIDHHLKAYGGMGSFNDVIICPENGHSITKEQAPWFNCLFNDLKTICFLSAKSAGKPIPNTLIERSMDNTGFNLQGWRCLDCGYSELTDSDIENYIAFFMVRKGIIKAVNTSNLKDFVTKAIVFGKAVTLHEKHPQSAVPRPHSGAGADKERENIKNIAIRSNINIAGRTGWMQPCPSCNRNNTAVYRWVIRNTFLFFGKIFVPAEVNLPLKK